MPRGIPKDKKEEAKKLIGKLEANLPSEITNGRLDIYVLLRETRRKVNEIIEVLNG